MNINFLVKAILLLSFLLIGYQSEAQIGRLGIKKPKINIKKPTIAAPSVNSSSSNNEKAQVVDDNKMELIPESSISPYETEYHKNHIGTIAFSDETIELKNVVESKLKTSFNWGEDIRFRVFMKKPIYNTVAELINADGGKKGVNCRPRSIMRYYLDGKLIYESGYGSTRKYNPAIMHFESSGKVIGYWVSYRGTLHKSDVFAHNEQSHFKEFLVKIGENITGKHQVKLELLAYDAENPDVKARQTIMATGEITIDFSTTPKPDLYNHPVICMPKSGTNTTALDLLKSKIKYYDRLSLLSFVESKPTRIIEAEVGLKENGKCLKYVVRLEQEFNPLRGVYDGPLKVTFATEKEEIYCQCLK